MIIVTFIISIIVAFLAGMVVTWFLFYEIINSCTQQLIEQEVEERLRREKRDG